MGELEQEYGNQVDFVIVSPEQTAASGQDLERFGFTALKHGLVAFDAAGEPVVMIPGHQFGREEIEAAVQQVLGG